MGSTPEHLLKEAVSGDAEALSTLLRRHGPDVQNRLHIDSQWRSMLEPEDVMQVTYLEAFMQIGRFDITRGTSFEGWLHQIAQNNLRDAVRGLSRQKQPQPRDRVQIPAGTDSYTGLLDMLCTMSATPSRDAGREENHCLIEHALQQLPADYAHVIRFYDLEGKTIGEVCDLMQRSTGAVHMLRARAHDCLRETLGTESMFFSTPA